MTYFHWISTTKMTIVVAVREDGVIVETAPIARKFLGQPIANLEAWMRRQGGFKKVELDGDA